MRFFLPVGGIVDYRFGILTNYNHKAVPVGIIQNMDWGGDVPVFGNIGFEPSKWIPWLKTMQPHRETCLFLTCPDVVSDAKMTITWYNHWRPYLNGWPVAFVGQDGMEDLEFPDPAKWDVLFVGGSDDWKESAAAVSVIKRAQELGKHIHIGRVNWGKKYDLFRSLEGSENFTTDGTRTRFDGVEKTIEAWWSYMQRPPGPAQFRFYLPTGNSGS